MKKIIFGELPRIDKKELNTAIDAAHSTIKNKKRQKKRCPHCGKELDWSVE